MRSAEPIKNLKSDSVDSSYIGLTNLKVKNEKISSTRLISGISKGLIRRIAKMEGALRIQKDYYTEIRDVLHEVATKIVQRAFEISYEEGINFIRSLDITLASRDFKKDLYIV